MKAALDRLLDKLDRTGGIDACWPYQDGYRNDRGYAYWTPYRSERFSSTPLAHRNMWELINRKAAPTGQVVRHTCDNPPCCNPAHLVLGTQRENVQDCIDKDRRVYAQGSACARAKLAEEDVRAMREAMMRGVTDSVLAAQYGVTVGNVGLIRKRRTWRHVEVTS